LTAFLTSLGANLRISDTFDDLAPSPSSTPYLRARQYSLDEYPLPPPSPLCSAIAMTSSTPDLRPDPSSDHQPLEPQQPAPSQQDPLAGVPTLQTSATSDPSEKIAALKLVADSVAQQRQMASRVLIAHPANLAVLTVVLAIAANWLANDASDWALVLVTWSGIVMSALVAIRFLTRRYIFLAEETEWAGWLGEDQVLVAKWGDEVIGACVLEWVRDEGKGKRRKSGRGEVRAWTVRLKYRGKGVGRGLLEEAVEVVNKRGGEGLDFAEGHASESCCDASRLFIWLRVLTEFITDAERVLPQYYNKAFDKRDLRAYDALQNVIAEKAHFGRRRSRGSNNM